MNKAEGAKTDLWGLGTKQTDEDRREPARRHGQGAGWKRRHQQTKTRSERGRQEAGAGKS